MNCERIFSSKRDFAVEEFGNSLLPATKNAGQVGLFTDDLDGALDQRRALSLSHERGITRSRVPVNELEQRFCDYPKKRKIGVMKVGHKIIEARKAKGYSQETLAEMASTTQSTIDRIERDDFKRMPSPLPKVAKILGLALEDLDPSFTAISASPAGLILSKADLMRPGQDFPVYASAEGGPGEIVRSSDPIDFVPRPAPVQHVKEAYGLIVTGTSMEPEFRPGDTLLVNPRLPLIGGEAYVFYSEVEGEARATVKNLRRATSDSWLVRQWNPEKDFALKKKEWRVCHRVLGKYGRQ